MPRIKGDVYDPSICDKLEKMFADGSSITKVAAVKIGISRSNYYVWKEKYPEFKAAAERAEEIGETALENIAIAGIKGEIKNFNGAMLQFIMSRRHRRTYGNDEVKEKSTGDTLLEQVVNGNVKIVKNDDK